MVNKPAQKLPKHCSWNLNRKNGGWRVRFRKRGYSVYLAGTPGSVDFVWQYRVAWGVACGDTSQECVSARREWQSAKREQNAA
jgi:hypothetical protein